MRNIPVNLSDDKRQRGQFSDAELAAYPYPPVSWRRQRTIWVFTISSAGSSPTIAAGRQQTGRIDINVLAIALLVLVAVADPRARS